MTPLRFMNSQMRSIQVWLPVSGAAFLWKRERSFGYVGDLDPLMASKGWTGSTQLPITASQVFVTSPPARSSRPR